MDAASFALKKECSSSRGTADVDHTIGALHKHDE
jgi:hypothetical protein